MGMLQTPFCHLWLVARVFAVHVDKYVIPRHIRHPQQSQ